MTPFRFELHLPDWLQAELDGPSHAFDDAEARMRFAIHLSALSASQDDGGPFGAAVFDMDSNELVSVGANGVVASQCSLMHAEIVAVVVAQRRVGRYDLAAAGGRYELVSSTEPCAMCLGALPWSGVRRLVCGARDEDARRIGFDEGAKPDDWPAELARRSIDVERDVCRSDAALVLERYARGGGHIYNAGAGD